MRIGPLEVRGFVIDDEDVCPSCAAQEEAEDALDDLSQVITSDDLEEFAVYYFCDRCNKRIHALD